MNRGLFSSDFVAALVVFLVALLIVSPMWSSLNQQVQGIESTRHLTSTALSATDALIRTKGYPHNWNSTNVKSLGLIETEERVLSANKTRYLFLFIQGNYSEAKFMLGAGAYEMGVEVLDDAGNPVVYEGTTFRNLTLPAEGKEVAAAQRLAILEYNGTSREFVNLRVTLWK